MSVSLLYMFVAGLYNIYKSLMNHYLDEHDVSRLDNFSGGDRHYILGILRLQNLMKKQTILVFIALISSLVYWSLISFFPAMLIQSGWDIVINVVCIWLMFGISTKHWNCLTKYLCCNACFADTDKFRNVRLESH